MSSREAPHGQLQDALSLREIALGVNAANKPRVLDTVRNFFYGLSSLEFEQQAREMRATLETFFLTITLGDMLGLPIIPPVYSLRILPHVVPQIASWKRRVLREREVSDSKGFDLHGM